MIKTNIKYAINNIKNNYFDTQICLFEFDLIYIFIVYYFK